MISSSLKMILIFSSLVLTDAVPNLMHRISHDLHYDTFGEHFFHVTRYEHSFRQSTEGKCGVLFNLAVKEYENHLKGTKQFTGVDKLLKNADFDSSKCEHAFGAFSWVLLVVQNGQYRCNVHIPLDVRNYKTHSPEESILEQHYAVEAVKKEDTNCHLPYSSEDDEVIHDEEDSEVQNQQSNIGQEIDGSVNNGSEDEDNLEDDFEAEIPNRGYSLHLHPSESSNKKNMDSNIAEDCNTEDLERVKDLYAAAVVKGNAAGFVLYNENIIDCKVIRGTVTVYDAEFNLNSHACDFQAVNDTANSQLKFLPLRRKDLPSCEEFRGLENRI